MYAARAVGTEVVRERGSERKRRRKRKSESERVV